MTHTHSSVSRSLSSLTLALVLAQSALLSPESRAYENGTPANSSAAPAAQIFLERNGRWVPCTSFAVASDVLVMVAHCTLDVTSKELKIALNGSMLPQSYTFRSIQYPPSGFGAGPVQSVNRSENERYLRQTDPLRAQYYDRVSPEMKGIPMMEKVLDKTIHFPTRKIPHPLDLAVVVMEDRLPLPVVSLAPKAPSPGSSLKIAGYGFKRFDAVDALRQRASEFSRMKAEIQRKLTGLGQMDPKARALHSVLNDFRNLETSLGINDPIGMMSVDQRRAGVVFDRHFVLESKKGSRPSSFANSLSQARNRAQDEDIRRYYDFLIDFQAVPTFTELANSDSQMKAILQRKESPLYPVFSQLTRQDSNGTPAIYSNTQGGDSGAPAFLGSQVGGVLSFNTYLPYPLAEETFVRVDLESAGGQWIQSVLKSH